MNKRAIYAGIGDWYRIENTGYDSLPFIYKNISDLGDLLGSSGWRNTIPLIDRAATINGIREKLAEEIAKSTGDDWLLFYYTGHGEKVLRRLPDRSVAATHYCVTCVPSLKKNTSLDVEAFLNEINYEELISSFAQKAPGGHLITILDCCFAFGLIENFAKQKPYHTIIAASSENSPAYYDDNSLFFKAFAKTWQAPFSQMENQVNAELTNLQSPNFCKIQVAQQFTAKSLTS